MAYLADIFKDTPTNYWIVKAPFKGDKYLSDTKISDLRIYNYALDEF